MPAALLFGPLVVCALGTVPVEQIEGYENQPDPSTGYYPYAPVNFYGNQTVTVTGGGDGGQFNGLTFHADPDSGTDQTISGHATSVGQLFYGSNSVATGYVTDVYAVEADVFFLNIVGVPVTGGSTGVGPVPGTFVGGSQVINNSYVDEEDSFSAYQNDNRRLDFMINQADVVWVAGAVTNGSGFTGTAYLSWSDFNSVAVTGIQNGLQSFNPTGSPGKNHADLTIPGAEASFATAAVSGYASALLGNAQDANQSDAQHGVLIRSLLMAGAGKNFSHPASGSPTGALDPVSGAGIPDYSNSLSMLQAGEKSLLPVTGGNTIDGTPATTQKGWAYSNVSNGTSAVVLIYSANAITGLTASLNWNVTSSQPAAGEIDTTDSAVIFPHLTLEVRPVTHTGGQYVLGTSLSNTDFTSNITGDNVQYIWSTSGLPAGNYAFLITGDATYSPAIGFSYELSGSFASRWNSSSSGSWSDAASWSNGVPNGQGAQVSFLSSPGLTSSGTITLDGSRTVGQINFSNTNSYTIAAGTGGTLTIDDSGDSSGTVSPQINVLAGNHTISANISLANGVAVTTANATSLTIAGAISGGGALTKSGNGSLIFEASSAGTATRNLPIAIDAGSAVLAASTSGNRQLLISSEFSIAGTSNDWAGVLNLNNNDLDLPSGSLATTTNQLKQGFADGTWNGSGGILSTSAAADTAHFTTLGIIQNNQSGTALFNSSNLFDGTIPGESDILVKYTYFGDANLDGIVDGSDYSLIDSGYLTGATGWFNGDFNYDGVINGSDYTLIDNAFNQQGASLAARSTAQIALVPEPTIIGLVWGIGTLLGRRRKTRTEKSH